MGTVALRIFIYSLLPLIIAVGHIRLDKISQSRERKLEVFLLYIFGVGVAGSGIGGFPGHFFISDPVAESIGWPTGNPFQLEVAFANLALGILGIVAMGRRDGSLLSSADGRCRVGTRCGAGGWLVNGMQGLS